MQETRVTQSNELTPSRRIRRRDEWQALLTKYAFSGLSQKAFCQLHQLSTSSFYQWKKKLSNDLPAATDFIDISPQSVNNADYSSSSSSYQVELELGNGMFLRVRSA